MSLNALAMSERQLEDAVIRLATMLGWLCHAERPAMKADGTWSTPIKGRRGFPDLTLARDGVVLFRELKSDKGRLRPDQKVWLDALPDADVWTPQNWIAGDIDRELA